MKIVKTTHYRDHEESETSDYVWFESNDQEEFMKKLRPRDSIKVNRFFYYA